MRRAAALAVATMLLAAPAATAGSRAKPYVLTALANVGTVYWFPFTANRLQSLEVSQMTEPRLCTPP